MKFIPNKQTYIGFAATLTGTPAAPKIADVTGAVDVTKYCTGLTAMTQGDSVPTPTFDTDFETNIPGVVRGNFSADFYADDGTSGGVNLAYNTFPRGTAGFVILARYGGIPSTAGRKCEVWPIKVLSRSFANMTSGQAVSFTVTAATPDVAAEDAVVAA